MAGKTFHNPNVPAVPVPLADVTALTLVTDRLRQGVESLGGIRGGSLDRAATLRDLVLLGLVSEDQVLAVLRGP
jgi:hypothetical protein